MSCSHDVPTGTGSYPQLGQIQPVSWKGCPMQWACARSYTSCYITLGQLGRIWRRHAHYTKTSLEKAYNSRPKRETRIGWPFFFSSGNSDVLFLLSESSLLPTDFNILWACTDPSLKYHLGPPPGQQREAVISETNVTAESTIWNCSHGLQSN